MLLETRLLLPLVGRSYVLVGVVTVGMVTMGGVSCGLESADEWTVLSFEGLGRNLACFFY